MADALVATEVELTRPGEVMSAEFAAAVLGTSTATLRFWEERFEYPVPVVSGDGRRRYHVDAVFALLGALQSELSVAAAMASASRKAPPRR
jgi:hypothetical protein